MNRNWVWVWRWLAGLALVVVLVGSLAPGYVTVVPFDLPDQKHFLAYLVLGFLFVVALGKGWVSVLVVAIGLTLMGFAVELLQDVIPGRYFRWVDVRANGVGAVVGVFLGWSFRTWVSSFRFPGSGKPAPGTRSPESVNRKP